MAIASGLGPRAALKRESFELETDSNAFLGLAPDAKRDRAGSRGENVPLDDPQASFLKPGGSAEVQTPQAGLARRPQHDPFDLVRAGTEKRPNRKRLPGDERASEAAVDQDSHTTSVIGRRQLEAGLKP